MKQSEAKEFLPLIKAWSEGKTLQIQHFSGEWEDVKGKENFSFTVPVEHCRIKPEPREFWVVLRKSDGHGVAAYAHKITHTHDENEIIHVREVLND